MFKLIVTAWMIVTPGVGEQTQILKIGQYHSTQACAIVLNKVRHELPRGYIIIEEECEQTLQRR